MLARAAAEGGRAARAASRRRSVDPQSRRGEPPRHARHRVRDRAASASLRIEVWLDDDLNFFGDVSSWSSTIREGFEADAKKLIDAQDARAHARGAELAKKHTINRRSRDRRERARVRSAHAARCPRRPPSSRRQPHRHRSDRTSERSAAEFIDAKGGVLLPGLWDMHAPPRRHRRAAQHRRRHHLRARPRQRQRHDPRV